MPIQTESQDSKPTSVRLIGFTERCGEFRDKERTVWINPAAVSHIAEYVPRLTVQPRSFVHMTNGETLELNEGPIYVVSVLQLGRTNVSPDSLALAVEAQMQGERGA